MTTIPSFSSFPDLEDHPQTTDSLKPSQAPSFSSFPEPAQAGPSRLPTPSFSSFPDVSMVTGRPEGESEKRRRRSRSRERFQRKEESRHKGESSRGSGRRREEDDDRDRARRRRERGDRNADEDRERKERKRRKERELADRLVKGESSRRKAESTAIERSTVEPTKGVGSWDGNDGRAWYETAIGTRRGRYEEPFDPTSSSAWFVDPVGDKDAVRYGSTSSHSAPRYHRDGSGRVLGLNDGLRIIFSRDRTEKGVEVAPKGRPYVPRYSARTLEGSASKHLGRLLLRPKEDDPFDPEVSFVTFGEPPEKTKEEETVPDYRSIDREEEEDEDLKALAATLSGIDTVEQDVRRQTAEMERYLQLHPADVDAWIRYSTLHLKLLPEITKYAANASLDPLKLPQNRATAEVTLSILARALDAHPTNFTSSTLHIAYIRAAEKFWERQQITGRWKNVIRELSERAGTSEDIAMMDIWLGFIDWKEGQGYGKSDKDSEAMEEVLEIYGECLEKLTLGQIVSDLQSKEEYQLYLLLRVCIFMRQAGYIERALATFQAMMEITFFKPDHLRPPIHAGPSWFAGVLSEFEGFWDDESPRFGEDGAPGWRNTDTLDFPPQETTEVTHIASDPFEKWLEAERHAESTLCRPGRAKNFDEEDDVDRVVMFDDIKAFLFPVRTPEVRLQLVYAFLTFVGLPFSPPDVSTSSPAAGDPHLGSDLAYNDNARESFWPAKPSIKRIPWQSVQGELVEPEQPSALSHPFGCPMKSWASERQTMFAQSSRWFRDLDAADLDTVDVPLVRNAFDLLRPLIPDPNFTLAYFAFESAVSPKSAVKVAKAILSEDRDNLLLWEGYARLERQRGNVGAARTVYATALQAALEAKKSDAEDDQKEVWASWAEMELEHDEKRCLEVLLMAAGLGVSTLASIGKPNYVPTTASPITMLKARQYYGSVQPLETSRLTLAALFAYLTGGIAACGDLIARQLEQLSPTSCSAEETHQLYNKIIHLHSSRHATPAALSRDALETAVKSFPNNTMFLSLYLFGELGNRVYGRVQRLISRISNAGDEGVVGHIWAVWAEAMSAHRTFWDQGGGGAERVRNALDKGINSSTGRQSVVLWRLYIEFEVLMGRHKSAKNLCYRAVAAIGGCKELYLLPFSSDLRPHHSPRELREWAQLITERGLRVRIPFEAYFDPTIEEEPTMVLPEDEELQEDEFKFLTEREALKPY